MTAPSSISTGQKVQFMDLTEELKKSPTSSEEENKLISDFLNLTIETKSIEVLRKPKKTLVRTVSEGLLGKKIKKDPPTTERQLTWQEAKKRWPNSTQSIQDDKGYQDLLEDYAEMFPTSINEKISIREILNKTEYRLTSSKVWSAWTNSNSTESFDEFVSQNADWAAYRTRVENPTRSYRNSQAWETYTANK